MLEKTINSILQKKINDWLNSIKDEELQKDLKNKVVITGGSIVSLVQNEKPNDFDIYLKDREITKRVAQYYCNQWNKLHEGQTNKLGIPFRAFVLDGKEINKLDESQIQISKDRQDLIKFFNEQSILSNGEHTEGNFSGQTRNVVSIADTDRIKIWIPSDGVVIDENYYEPEDLPSPEKILEDADEVEIVEEKSKEKYRPIFLTSNAISLSDKIQIVIRFWGEPDQIHENYDYLHCKAYWTSWDKKVVIPSKVYEAIINKSLIYTGSLYPICSLFRMRKFIKRGWNINAGQILKISWQISELDLTNIDTLEDQLVGVDSLYFLSLIHALRDHQEKNKDWNISREYVTTIIDRIF